MNEGRADCVGVLSLVWAALTVCVVRDNYVGGVDFGVTPTLSSASHASGSPP
jgi:hypothetical protein